MDEQSSTTQSRSKPFVGFEAALKIAPGDHIRVTERIVGHDRTWLTQVEGEVLSCKPETTGSWFALGKNDKLWLLRIRLRRPDGEISALNIDQNTQVELLEKKA